MEEEKEKIQHVSSSGQGKIENIEDSVCAALKESVKLDTDKEKFLIFIAAPLDDRNAGLDWWFVTEKFPANLFNEAIKTFKEKCEEKQKKE